jgi:hypothetical protein
LRVEVKFFDWGSSSEWIADWWLPIDDFETEHRAALGQSARPTQVAGQPVVSANGSWMSVFSTATGLFAIVMPKCFQCMKSYKSLEKTDFGHVCFSATEINARNFLHPRNFALRQPH